MSTPAAAPEPAPEAAPSGWEAYPPQVEAARKAPPETALAPYVAPAADAPDEVDVAIRPGWRQYLWTLVTVAFVGMMTAGFAGGSMDPTSAKLLVGMYLLGILVLAARIGMHVRPSRIRIDGEGMTIKPRTFGIDRHAIHVPWHAVSEVELMTRMEGSGKSREKVSRLGWRARPGVGFPGLKSANGWYEIRLGDISDNRLADLLKKYKPPDLSIEDATLF